ncbi:MAG: S41 family peptidase [Gemmatimonadaceae bacterium]|nr:S41 family peptidase [Gemmatimonadaceae bacterium]
MSMPTRTPGLVALAAGALVACHRAPDPTPAASPLGRWQVGMPAWGVETTLEIADSNGVPVSAFLGQHGPVRVRGTALDGARFRMGLHADGQDLAVAGRVDARRMEGQWFPDHPIKRWFARGAALGARLDTSELASLPASAPAVTAEIRRLIATRVYDPRYAGADWDRRWDDVARHVAAASSDRQALQLITQALETYGQSHLRLEAVPTRHVLPPAAPRAVSRVDVLASQLPSGVGLVRIRNFLDEGPVARDSLRAAFRQLAGAPGVILDLRGNPGGSIVLADHLAAALSDAPVEVGAFVLRAGYERWGQGAVQGLPVAQLPRLRLGDTVRAANFFTVLERLGGAAVYTTRAGDGSAYRGPVAVLVDRRTASTAEGVAAGLRSGGRAVLVGERTAGAMLAAAPHRVATGWFLTLPLADFWTLDGLRLEGVGLTPDIVVADARRQPQDAAIAAAEQWIAARRTPATRAASP